MVNSMVVSGSEKKKKKGGIGRKYNSPEGNIQVVYKWHLYFIIGI